MRPSGTGTVRAAVVQAAPVAFDRDRTLERVAQLTAARPPTERSWWSSRRRSCRAIPRAPTSGRVVGSRTAEGREWFRRYHESGVDIPGPAIERLGAIARSHRVHLVVGVIERDGGTLYCTVVFIGPDGQLAGQASQAHADRVGAAHLGLRRRLDAARPRDAPRPHRRGHLLGELHAPAAARDVRAGHRAVLRPDRRRPRDVAPDDAPHRHRGPLLRAVGQPVRPPVRLPGRLSGARPRAPRPCSSLVAAASSTRSGRCSPDRRATARRS